MLIYFTMKYLYISLIISIFLPLNSVAIIPVKVVIVSMFEYGADTGDAPGEFQFWVEGNDVSKVEAPLGSRDYYISGLH